VNISWVSLGERLRVPGRSPASGRLCRLVFGTDISFRSLAAAAVRGDGRLCQGLGQGGEVGDHSVHTGERENPQDRGAGNDQQHLTASARDLLCAAITVRSPEESQNQVLVMSTPLTVPDRTIGALNLYSGRPLLRRGSDPAGRALRQGRDHRRGHRRPTGSPGRADLRRLRLNGLIRWLPHTNRCTLTSDGIRIAVFYTKIYNRLLIPLTAANQPQAPPELRAALAAITHHVDDYANRARLLRAA
jgi:hypothetical protein